ncbi:hypothetical protein NLM33_35615 [Bradyrhizobium sp. CCGUVB1N3]|uniref:hypothetical protein n=1 Tax=Bradyrhizobium sp. CCGUVB1N3 TaxID=2949629 RepID=UPI0020B3AE54|nr:hypothetical protein [Bradyrhizobium sp. CCGUVB1N3]MCP3475605.1 hypothetical protein [Bradyrhizobium sp. CCGUVB1N3]
MIGSAIATHFVIGGQHVSQFVERHLDRSQLRVEGRNRLGNEQHDAVCQMTGAAGAPSGVQNLVRRQCRSTVVIVVFVPGQDRELMAWTRPARRSSRISFPCCGFNRGLLSVWRRQARLVSSEAPQFVQVRLDDAVEARPNAIGKPRVLTGPAERSR